MPPFDPDEYLARPPRAQITVRPFDPDEYLRGTTPAAPSITDDPSGGMFSSPEATAVQHIPFTERAADVAKGTMEGGLLAADAATYGLGNRALAYGRSFYDQDSYANAIARNNTYLDQLRKDNPHRAIAAELTGGFLGGSGLARAGLTLAKPGVGWISRIARGTAEGAAHGAAQGVGQNYGTLEDKAFAGGAGALAGGVIGFGVPAAVSGVKGITSLVNSMRGRTPEFPPSLLRGVEADRPGVANLTQTYGPEAMLPDAGPTMRGIAQGAATTPSPGRTALIEALINRDRQTAPRIQFGTEAALGPDVVPSVVRADIRAGQRALSPEYDAVFSGSGVRAIDNTALAQHIDAQIPNLRGEAQTALGRVRRMLNIRGTNELDPYPPTLQATRQAIDGMLESPSISNNTRRVLTDVRNRITEELHTKVPGINQVDAQFAALARQREAFERGEAVFDTGREQVVRPQELRASHANTVEPQAGQVGPPTAAAERIRSRQGSRAEVGRLTGTSTNELRALESRFGEGNWATQNLAEQFGVQNAEQFRNLIRTNRHFRETYQKIVHGSKTAETLAAAEDAGPGLFVPTSTSQWAMEMARRAVDKASARGGAETRNRIAQVMATQGPELAQVQQRLLAAGDEQAREDVARMIIENAIRRSLSGAVPSMQGR